MITPVTIAALLAAASLDAAPRPLATTPASRGLVVVLSPEAGDEVTRNAMVRITGELGAAPFQVVSERVDPSADVMTQVETAGRDLGPVAAFAIVREPGEAPGNVAVWVSNRITRTTTVQRMRVRGGDVDGAAAHLAVEAVELVRASMAGLWPRAPGTPGDLEAKATSPAPIGPSNRLAVGVGVGLYRDLGSSPAFWAPALEVAYGAPERLAVRLELVGLGPGADLTMADGTGARLQWAAAELGVVRLFRAGRTLQPMLTAGAGAELLRASGTGAPAERVHDQSAWSAGLAAGGGLSVAFSAHVAAVAEARLIVTWPSAVVEVEQTEVARFDRLSLFGVVGLHARF